jgi:glycosyltransferase involved in cell wall biosynthesis
MSYLNQYSVKYFVEKLNLSTSKSRFNSSNSPKISIVIASYNQDKYLERTILSILNQQYKNTEIIIIDGGSTDKSVEIIKKYDKQIAFWVSEKDNGQTHAINKGLKMAKGDLLCFQNSDDLFCENAFEILSNFYLKNPNSDCYFGDLLFIDVADNVLEVLKTSDFNLKSQILEGVQIFNQSFFFKKSVLDRFGYLDESLRFVLDYENVLRWAYGGAIFVKVNGLFGAFRIHDDAKTSNLQSIRETEHEIVKQKYKKLVFSDKNLSKIDFLFLRLKKIMFFVKNLDFAYIFYRFTKKNKN